MLFCAVFKRISVVLRYSYPPYIVHLPPSLWHFIRGALNQVNMVFHTYNCKKKIIEELFTLSSELPFLADLVF